MNEIINWCFAGLMVVIGIFGLVSGNRETMFVTVYWVRLSPADTAAAEQFIQVLIANGRHWVEPFWGMWAR